MVVAASIGPLHLMCEITITMKIISFFPFPRSKNTFIVPEKGILTSLRVINSESWCHDWPKAERTHFKEPPRA